MSAFSVYITEAGDAEGGGTDDTEPASDTGIEQDESGTLASAVLATSLCGTDERKVTGTMSYPISVEYEWSVTIEPAEDEAGAAFAADALFPSRGSLTWSGSTEIGRATLTTDDASAIADGQWPATISGRGWSASVGVLLE